MNNSNLLYIASIIRIIVSFIILFYIKIPQFIKILLLMLTEILDCSPSLFGGPLFINSRNICKTELYQQTDKITDIIIYSMLLFQIYSNNLLNKIDFNLILWLFIYRLLGTIIFLITKNSKYLIYFANFFLWITLTIFIIKYFNKNYKNYKNYKLLFVFISSLKIVQENYLHGRGILLSKKLKLQKCRDLKCIGNKIVKIIKSIFKYIDGKN